jgi:hypothetical protein
MGKVRLTATQAAVLNMIPRDESLPRWKAFIGTNANQRTLDILEERELITISCGGGWSDDCWLKLTPAGRAHLASSGKTSGE